MIRKSSLTLISMFALFGAIGGQADDVLPPRFNFDRYAAMMNHSPFAIATAIALPSATPDFARDLYVANAARSPDGDMVTIASSSDQNFKKYVSTKEPVDGYSIASIEWSDRVGATKVTISKDGKFATITFNEALLSQPPPNAPLVPNPPTAAVPAVPTLPSPSVPSVPRQVPRPHVRGTIQRNPRAVPAPTPNFRPPQVEQ
ncbi:MAG: hypothetical protein DMC62_04195 [Verrucomicrobia bacterium]|jgi:hypothetical protein|nr:MAG: hypothetical protein DMC62_04195 [Verrucomicrobiota bacterium]